MIRFFLSFFGMPQNIWWNSFRGLYKVLTHSMLLVFFFTFWKHQKTRGFIMFSGILEIDQLHKMGWKKKSNSAVLLSPEMFDKSLGDYSFRTYTNFSEKTSIFYPIIRTRFSEDFTYVLNQWSLGERLVKFTVIESTSIFILSELICFGKETLAVVQKIHFYSSLILEIYRF